MRITDALLTTPDPVFSFEFFPPKTDEGVAQLFETVEALRPLEPDYVSVTYGAGGGTRDGTVEIATRIKRDYGIETMAHLSCVGETREGLEEILDRFADAGIENVLALRGDPPRGEDDLRAARGRAGQRRRADRVHRTRTSGGTSRSAAPASRRSTPRRRRLEDDLRYLKTKVDAGAQLPDHPALLRQRRLLGLRRARRARAASTCRSSPA